MERKNVPLDCFLPELAMIFLVNWKNGALVGKRLVAMRSPSSRRSWIVFALSIIRVFMLSDVVVDDGVLESVGVLSMESR